jgi:Uma2 family endonuclease
MLKATKTGATYEDVRAAPADMRAELIDGDLYLQPRPRGLHQHVLSRLVAELDPESARRGADRWVVLAEVELHIPLTLVPDVSVWHVSRFAEGLDAAYFTVVPDLVCEVLSPGTHAYDRGLKAQKYLDAGVLRLWLVDPAERTLETYMAEGGAWKLLGVHQKILRTPDFGAIHLERCWEL